MSKKTIVVNRGQRTYNLIEGPEGVTRTLPPGGSIEVLDEKEAKHLLRYHDIKDIKEAEPQTHARIEAHQREIDRLKAENAALLEKHKGAASKGDSVEALNEESAGTGFAGPGGPNVPGAVNPNPETEPTHQPIPEDKNRKGHKR